MHTAERWLQEGRQVRPGEQPCGHKNRVIKSSKSSTASKTKSSKAKPDKPTSSSKSRSTFTVDNDNDENADGEGEEEGGESGQVDNEGPSSALFGEWQTDIYVPPVMVDVCFSLFEFHLV